MPCEEAGSGGAAPVSVSGITLEQFDSAATLGDCVLDPGSGCRPHAVPRRKPRSRQVRVRMRSQRLDLGCLRSPTRPCHEDARWTGVSRDANSSRSVTIGLKGT